MTTPARARAAASRRGVRRRARVGAVAPSLFLLAAVVYFLAPLAWLFIASSKTESDLFSTFGLWFAKFNLHNNIRDLFGEQGGDFLLWTRNTLMYSVTSAVGAALIATAAGYGFAKYEFRGKNALFWFVLGSVMVPTTALAIPTYLLFAEVGLTNNPLSIILPSLVSPFGIYL